MYRKTYKKQARRKSLHALSDNDETFLLLSIRSLFALSLTFTFLHSELKKEEIFLPLPH